MSYTTPSSIGAIGAGQLHTIDISGQQSNHPYRGGYDIRITPATGGYIISVVTANTFVEPELHIVTDSQDLGAAVNQIITMHCLRKT